MENRYLIAGLGNPGREYERTRHNAGFLVLDALAGGWQAAWTVERKFQARMARQERDGKQVLLCQPGTFMNCSGEVLGPLMNFHKIPPERLLVSVDDADLPLGEIRMRPRGSSGGHHGLESIERHLGTRDFPRQRIGIGRESGGVREITGYVLTPFRPAEQKLLEKVLQNAREQIECWLASGIGPAMNRYNGITKD